MEEDEILKYSMQIAMLKQLLRKELINEKEYEKIKKKLMEEYKIVFVKMCSIIICQRIKNGNQIYKRK